MAASNQKEATKAAKLARLPINDHGVPSCFVETHGVITSTMNDLPGYRIVKVLGAIFGITVRTRNWGADIGAWLKSSIGGEVSMVTNLMYTSRSEALERLVGECMQRGGNAIIALRFDQGEIQAFSQVCAYGTAVIVEKIDERSDIVSHGAI
ncbi:UPF0145 domain-containing protein [Bisporella sp. PMI_857]|nr:UPF0145 domain-containing protein [Bisporella sp. PMI_857]